MADLKNKLSYGSKGTVASSNATGGVEITTPEIRTETDPRSTILTNQDRAIQQNRCWRSS